MIYFCAIVLEFQNNSFLPPRPLRSSRKASRFYLISLTHHSLLIARCFFLLLTAFCSLFSLNLFFFASLRFCARNPSLFRPIFYLQTFYPTEVAFIIGNQDQIMGKCSCCKNKIKIIQRSSCFFQFYFQHSE